MDYIFDTHAHYDDAAFDDDRDTLLSGLREHGIGYVVNVGASLASCEATLELTKQYPFVYGALGVHPNETGGLPERALQWLKESSRQEKIVAIGEIGLDYYWDEPERTVQKKWFLAQLAAAKEEALPVIIHSRDAAKDTLDIMKAERDGLCGGVIHCFSYSVEIAREYLNMGFYLGIGGVLTYKNARNLKEVVEYAPLSSLVLETDCPYLTPHPNRGKRNSSQYLPLVVEALAQMKKTAPETIIQETTRNAGRLYGLETAAEDTD